MTETDTRAVELPQALKKLAEGRVRLLTKRLRECAVGSIRTYTEYLTEAAEKLSKAEETATKEVQEWAENITRLKEAGFKPETNDWDLDIVVNINERRLPDVARAIGPLNEESIDKSLHDHTKGLVKVRIYGLKVRNVKVVYIHKLKPTDRCKIVEELVPAKVEHRLVCDV
jgi:hypothetical protein